MAEVAKEIVKEVYLPTVGEVEVKASPGWTSWRTLGFGLLVAITPVAFDWFTKIDWTLYFNPTVAMFVAGVGTIAFRWITTGPMFSNISVKKVQD